MKKMKTLIGVAVLLLSCTKSYADANDDLKKAVMTHNIDGMKSAIAASANVDYADPANGNSVLFAAVWWPDAVKTLIDAKANVNLKNKAGDTPLTSAAMQGETESIKLLLAAGADVKSTDATGNTALNYACFASCRADALQALIDAGADPNSKDNAGLSCLFNLCVNCSTPAEKVTLIKSQAIYFAKAGLALNHRYTDPKESDYSSIGEMVDVMVKAKADVNYSIGHGFTILNYAAKMGRNDAIIALIKAGADVHVKTVNGWTALCYAADRLSCAQGALALVATGADVNTVIPAAGFNQENGAASVANDIDAGDEKLVKQAAKKVTPLMLAAKEGDLELVNALIAAKADLDAVYEASAATHWNVIIGVGTTTTTTSESGTAMTLAADFSHPEVVAALQKAGAKSVKDALKSSKKK